MTKKEEIMDATYHLMIKNGLYNVSINDVKNSADTSPGTIFYYFESKNELIETVLTEYLLKMYIRQLDTIKSYEGNTYESLKQFCHKIIELENSDISDKNEIKNGLLCFFEGKKDFPSINESFNCRV